MKKLILSLSLICIAVSAVASVVVSSAANAMSVREQSTRILATKTQVKMEVDVGADPTNPSTALDILFVIDDSGSMIDHQAKLLANVGDLVRASLASGADVHAGVVTTSMDTPWGTNPSPWNGELAGVSKKFASSRHFDFEKVLTENLKKAMTTNGSGSEQPFAAVKAALSEPHMSGVNQGFLRQGAALAVFVLTDTDDQSTLPVADFVSFLKGLKMGPPVTMHAAYVPVAEKTCSRAGEDAPVRLEEALAAFGTISESFSLCDSFGAKLGQIGSGYEAIGLRTVQLKLVPDLTTLKVTYGTSTLPAADLLTGWVYDSAKMQIKFGEKIDWYSQPRGTPIFIEYFAK